MIYTVEVEINQPLDKVIKLMDNPDNMKYWQPGFISYELLSKKAGEPGSQMKLKYKMGKQEIEMVETIIRRELPDHFDAKYEAKGVYNEIKNQFIKISDNKTKWISQNEFRFTNFMMKMFGLIMPGSFKKQSQIYLDKFKEFAEKSE